MAPGDDVRQVDRLGVCIDEAERGESSLRQYRQPVLSVSGSRAGVLHSVEERNTDGKLIRTRYFDIAGNVKTVSSMLRHGDMKTTLGIYSHAVDSNKLAAQGQFLSRLPEGESVQ